MALKKTNIIPIRKHPLERWLIRVVVLILLVNGVLLYEKYGSAVSLYLVPQGAEEDIYYVDCSVASKRFNCVVDGDTIWSEGIKIRVLDIDTPEIFSPKCDAEYELGVKAQLRLIELLNQGPFEIVANTVRDEDKYGRKLRTLARNGQSLGDVLVQEGLARRWSGSRMTWCAN